MRKRKLYIALITVLMLVFSFLARSSLSTILQSIQQRFAAETDTVEVILEDKLQRTTPIVPESKIPLDMKARNLGADCYVRFKVSVYSGTGGELMHELGDTDMILAEGWSKKEDGYYYYKNIFKEDEIIDLYDAVIARSGIVTQEEQKLTIQTTIQAIQSTNYDMDNGWGNVVIQQTMNSRRDVILDE